MAPVVAGMGLQPSQPDHDFQAGALGLAWSWAVGAGPFQVAPVVHNGIMYLGESRQHRTGAGRRDGRSALAVPSAMDERRRLGAQMRTLSVCEDKVYIGTVEGHIVALDARIGSVRWDTPIEGPGGTRPSFSSAPIVAERRGGRRARRLPDEG